MEYQWVPGIANECQGVPMRLRSAIECQAVQMSVRECQ